MTKGYTEAEVRELRSAINKAEGEAADAHKRASELAGAIREAGKNPLTDKEAFGEVDAAYRAADERKQEAAELRLRLDAVIDRAGEAERRAERGDKRQAQSVADRFIRSDVYQRLASSNVLDSSAAIGATAPVEVRNREELMRSLGRNNAQLRATVDVTNIMVGEDQQLFPPVDVPVRQVRLFDLITIGATDSDTVEYVKEDTRTDNVSNVAYGTAAAEGTYAYSRVTESVRRIATSVPATKGNLADQGQLRTLLGGRLMNAWQRHVETQVLAGDGVGENFTGIANAAGTLTYARDTVTPESRLDALHKGITKVRVTKFADPTAIGLHPNDYEEIVLSKDGQSQYLLTPATQSTTRSIWGLPVIVSTVFTEGTAWIADWSDATYWARSGVSVAASDSHTDFFTKSLVMLLAEGRGAFAVTQPKGFCSVTAL